MKFLFSNILNIAQKIILVCIVYLFLDLVNATNLMFELFWWLVGITAVKSIIDFIELHYILEK